MDTSYDTVVYPGRPFAVTQPSRLGVLPAIFGLDYAPPEDCRVLEIGCGDGGNLIPMAAAWPGSRFVGFDLAHTQIEAGQAAVAELGLDNIRLATADICDPGELGEFDYIIAHGIYAWVPAPVREALMALIGRALSPRGVAYVSYNVLPGWHVRQQIREMLLLRLQGVDDPRERLTAARAFLTMLAEALDPEHPRSAGVRTEAAAMLQRPPEVLFHDELGEFARAFTAGEFIAHAQRHGLQYLGDADPTRLEPRLPQHPAVHALVDGLADDDARLQSYVDVLTQDTFRRTILRRGEGPIEKRLDPARLDRLHVSSRVSRDASAANAYSFAGGSRLQAQDKRLSDLLDALGAAWPQALPIAGLDEELLPTLLRLHLMGLVELEAAPSPFVRQPGARPRAGAVARWQARQGRRELTTLTHRELDVDSDDARAFVALLDGSRGPEELAEAMGRRAAKPREEVVPLVAAQLDHLARTALLEA